MTTNPLVLSSTVEDAAASVAIEQHHAELTGALTLRVGSVVAAAEQPSGDAPFSAARDALVDWCERELLPHAYVEEARLYPAARALAEGRLLVDALLREHETIARLVEEIRASVAAVRAAAAARALLAMFESHVGKENDLVLPLLSASPGPSLSSLLAGMHEELDAPGSEGGTGPAAEPHGSGSCGCGGHDEPGMPELDARAVPHAIRHATIFGALDSLVPGAGMVLVAPHDPVRLLAQLEDRAPGRFGVEYLTHGPETWRLAIVRDAGQTAAR